MPCRMAPVAGFMRRTSSSEKMADMMAKPPGRRRMRSGRIPGNSSLPTSPVLISAARSFSRPSAVRQPSLQPRICRTSPSERAVPEEPTASSQWPAENSRAMVSSSTRAASSACFKAPLLILPSGKNLRLQVTAPMYRLSNWCGLNPLPMMNSVEPPPMSTTRRLSSVTGRLRDTPR